MPKYSDSEWREISTANCIDVAQALGLTFNEKKSDKKALRVNDRNALFIWRVGNGWFRMNGIAGEEKGFAINLVQDELKCSYREALDFIHEKVLGKTFDYVYEKGTKEFEPKGEMELPQKAENNNRVLAYLIKTRCIDKDIVYSLINKGKIYQEKDTGNCCFIGTNKDGEIKSCTTRGTTEKHFHHIVEYSEKKYAFKIEGSSKILKVFESPIDAMSHATLYKINGQNWKADTRLALSGCSDETIDQELADNPGKYNEIWICTDSDKGGQRFKSKFFEKYKDDFIIKIKDPKGKDWNEDLQAIKNIATEANCTTKEAMDYYYLQQPIAELELCEYEEVVLERT